MLKINTFEMTRIGFMDGISKKSYETLKFSGGRIDVKDIDDCIHVTFDEDVRNNTNFNIYETINLFKNAEIESIFWGETKYRIGLNGENDNYGNTEYKIIDVIDNHTLVFQKI